MPSLSAQDLLPGKGDDIELRPVEVLREGGRCGVADRQPLAVGGLDGLIARSEANLAVIARWVERTPWVDFLAEAPDTRSCTSICLKLVAPWFTTLAPQAQAQAAKQLATLLEKEGVAYDIASYRDAPPGLRIWGGATVETADIALLLPWLDWAHDVVQAEQASAKAAA